jgi:hypothetical protein
MSNQWSEDTDNGEALWDLFDQSMLLQPETSEEALAKMLLLGETWDADGGAKSLQEQAGKLQEEAGKLADWHEHRKVAFNKAAEILIAERQGLISDAEKRSERIIHDAEQRSEAILAEANEVTEKWNAEMTALAWVQHFEPIVNLNVGGVRVSTSLTTLGRFPDTMIGCMFSGRHTLPKGEDGYFFIDRDGTHFRHILNFLRSPESYKPVLTDAEEVELMGECKYYGIDELMFPADEMMFTSITGTDKSLPYYDFATSSPLGSIDVRVGDAGVLTIRDSGGKIEYCRGCHSGLFNIGVQRYCFINSIAQSPPAAQPQEHTCLHCR